MQQYKVLQTSSAEIARLKKSATGGNELAAREEERAKAVVEVAILTAKLCHEDARKELENTLKDNLTELGSALDPATANVAESIEKLKIINTTRAAEIRLIE